MKLKKTELRRIMKPIVEELVEEVIEEMVYQDDFIKDKLQEMLLHGGLLSNVITEVAKGLDSSRNPEAPRRSRRPIREDQVRERTPEAKPASFDNWKSNLGSDLDEYKAELASNASARMLEGAAGLEGIFEGVDPISAAGVPGDGNIVAAAAGSAMAGQAPDDPGLSIDGLFGAFGDKWQQEMKKIK